MSAIHTRLSTGRHRMHIPGPSGAHLIPPAILQTVQEAWPKEQAWRRDQERRFRARGRLVRFVATVCGAVRRFFLDALLAVVTVLALVHVFYGGERLAELITEWGITVQVAGGLAIFFGVLTLVGLRMAERIEPEPKEEDGIVPGRKPAVRVFDHPFTHCPLNLARGSRRKWCDDLRCHHETSPDVFCGLPREAHQ